jgi:di/tricarboxylate transporter
MEHWFILGLIGLALFLFALEIVRPDIVALGVTLTLLLSGLITIDEGFLGFSNPAVITVIGMFILSSGLVRTGVADQLAQMIARVGSGDPTLLTVTVMLTVGLLSAFMNNIGAVAILLPAIFIVAQQSNYPATKLLMPLSFGSLLGGLTTLIGTPPNLLVSIALEEHGFRGFRMFDFLPTGLVVMATGTVYMATIGRRLIPARRQPENLTRRYKLQNYLTEVVIPAGSPLIGKSLRDSGLRQNYGLTVTRIRRGSRENEVSFSPAPETTLREEDQLIVEGDISQLLQFKGAGPLQIYASRKFTDESLTGEGVQLAEVAIAPNANILGNSINQGQIRRLYGVLVLALRRRGRTLQERFTSLPLEVGDVLLVQGTPDALQEVARSSDFLVVNRLEHAVREPKKAPLALLIMAISVVSAATGLLHITTAAMIGVLLMALTGCVKMEDMYKDVDWRVIFLIAFMLPLGIAMDQDHTGTAGWLAQHVVNATGGYGPLVVMGSILLFATLVTEMMSNAAAAVLLAPIGIAIAQGMGLQPHPFLMAIAIGASTTFLTPVGHQSNVLVYGVGNYRFTDFPRTGALLNLLIFIVTLVIVPIIWPFQPLQAP